MGTYCSPLLGREGKYNCTYFKRNVAHGETISFPSLGVFLVFIAFEYTQSFYSTESHKGQLRPFIGGPRGLSNCFKTEMCSWHF